MTESTAIAKLDGFKQALALATTIEEIVDLRNMAEIARQCAKVAGLGLEAQNHAAEYRIDAEVETGKALGEMKKNKGGNPNLLDGQTGCPPTLEKLGISRFQSHRWQREARIPDGVRVEYIEKTKADEDEVTTAGLLRYAKQQKKENREPKPQAEIEAATKEPRLIVGCAEDLHQLEDRCVDLIITSPPYNLGDSHWPMGGEGHTPRDGGIGYDDGLDELAYQAWQVDVLCEIYRVAKPGASFFYNHKVKNRDGLIIHPLDWLRNKLNPWILRQEIVWDRGSTHNHSPTLFWPHDERIYWMTKGPPTLPDRPIGLSTVWQFTWTRGGTWHPAPFPEELPRKCIEAIGREGITVLDPFAGSCTTLKIALEYGYDAIGVDVSAEYLMQAARENGWTSTSETLRDQRVATSSYEHTRISLEDSMVPTQTSVWLASGHQAWWHI